MWTATGTLCSCFRACFHSRSNRNQLYVCIERDVAGAWSLLSLVYILRVISCWWRRLSSATRDFRASGGARVVRCDRFKLNFIYLLAFVYASLRRLSLSILCNLCFSFLPPTAIFAGRQRGWIPGVPRTTARNRPRSGRESGRAAVRKLQAHGGEPRAARSDRHRGQVGGRCFRSKSRFYASVPRRRNIVRHRATCY